LHHALGRHDALSPPARPEDAGILLRREQQRFLPPRRLHDPDRDQARFLTHGGDMRARSLVSFVLAAAGLVLAMTAARAAEIKVIASNAVKEAYIELLPAFEQASGHKVNVDWGGTADIRKRIEAGEAADLVIIPSFTIDALLADGRLQKGSRADLVRS